MGRKNGIVRNSSSRIWTSISIIEKLHLSYKNVLKVDGYDWSDNKISLNLLTRACKIQNDRVKTRLPIQIKLLELILFEVERYFEKNPRKGAQPYLRLLYQSIFLLGYYGLMRVGELTTGNHSILAKNIHIGSNKNKILILLYSSKTHGRESRLQEIKISEVKNSTNKNQQFFCPFASLRKYLKVRGDYLKDTEPFFIFQDKSPVKPCHVRTTLRLMLT